MTQTTKVKKLKTRGGQVLIESIVAISILTIGFLGISSLLSRAISLNRVVSDNYVATYLAMEGIEISKNILDANVLRAGTPWNFNFVPGGDFRVSSESESLDSCGVVDCFAPLRYDTVEWAYGYSSGRETSFVRVIRVEPVGANELRISSLVDWTTRGGGKFNIELEDHFYNWRP